MASPELQAFAAERFPVLHDAVYAVIDAHPDCPAVDALKAALDEAYTDFVDVAEIAVVQNRSGGHKPPPEDPPPPAP